MSRILSQLQAFADQGDLQQLAVTGAFVALFAVAVMLGRAVSKRAGG